MCTKCGYCANEDVCHVVTGTCPGGCADLWTGDQCGTVPQNILTNFKATFSVYKLIPKNAQMTTLCPSPTVPNLLLNEDELTIQVCSGDHSWSF